MFGLFNDSKGIENAKIQVIGVLVQGIYVYYSYGKLDNKFFIMYLFLTFISSLLYYKVFLTD